MKVWKGGGERSGKVFIWAHVVSELDFLWPMIEVILFWVFRELPHDSPEALSTWVVILLHLFSCDFHTASAVDSIPPW